MNLFVDLGPGPRTLVLAAHHDAVPGSPGRQRQRGRAWASCSRWACGSRADPPRRLRVRLGVLRRRGAGDAGLARLRAAQRRRRARADHRRRREPRALRDRRQPRALGRDAGARAHAARPRVRRDDRGARLPPRRDAITSPSPCPSSGATTGRSSTAASRAWGSRRSRGRRWSPCGPSSTAGCGASSYRPPAGRRPSRPTTRRAIAPETLEPPTLAAVETALEVLVRTLDAVP